MRDPLFLNIRSPTSTVEKMRTSLNIVLVVLATILLFQNRCRAKTPQTQQAPASSQLFLSNHSLDCHDPDAHEGDLDLSALTSDLDNPRSFDTWVKIHDRVHKGEMPPDGGLSDDNKNPYIAQLSKALMTAEAARVKQSGRSSVRRLNRFEFENTLRDLLGVPWLQLANRLPEEGIEFGFNRSAGALQMSHVQLDRFLDAADYALREAAAYYLQGIDSETTRYYARDQLRFLQTMNLGGPAMRHPFPILDGKADPRFLELSEELSTKTKRAGRHKVLLESTSTDAEREAEAIGVVVSTYEPTEIRFNNFTVPVAGKYRLRLRAYSIWVGAETVWVGPDPKWGLMERARRTLPDFTRVERGRRNEPITIYSDRSPRILRKIGSFDITPDPKTYEIEAYLLAGETIRPDAARLFRCRGSYPINPLSIEDDGMPGVAFQWLEVEGPLLVDSATKVNWSTLHEESRVNFKEAIRSFMEQTYCGPFSKADVLRFSQVAHSLQKDGETRFEALISAYKAILCSPGFLYLQSEPGKLEDTALASRLSSFLINSAPDEELRSLARRGVLREPAILRGQTERLLDSVHSQRFVKAFLDYWLDLRKVSATSPDGSLYPDYQLDDLLVESITEEPQAFFKELFQDNLPAKNLISADFAMLNERLASHYGIHGVDGVRLQRVRLPAECVRGGVMTQAATLKVTSDGTTTSPVLRGAWIARRLLGIQIPPPPEGVPTVEPDTRGATTIREILDIHRNIESCAACHRRIDPFGFALEAFDVMGGYRTQYRAISGSPIQGAGHNGRPYEFHNALPVKTDGTLSNGRPYEDVRQLKQLLVEDERRIARNLLEKLIVYATGAPIGFSDRTEVDKMMQELELSGFLVRDIIHQAVQSNMFRHQ